MSEPDDALSADGYARYARQLRLPEIGLEGQRRLAGASVLVVGVGGLGAPVALYLAAAGVGRLGLVDDDVVEIANLQRQIVFGSATLGRPKVAAARERLADLNPLVEVVAHAERFTRDRGERLAAGYDVIVDATDNFVARYAVSDVAVRLGVPNVYGAVQRFEGQASVFDATRGPCYRCAFPSPPPAGLAPPCGEVGVLGAVPGVIGTIQATEALKLLLGAGSTLVGRLLLHDALAMTFDVVRLGKDPACLACGPAADPSRLAAIDASCDVGACTRSDPPSEATIEPVELARRLTAGRAVVLDVREPHEHAAGSIAGARLVPLGELAARVGEFDPETPVVVVCRSGARAARAVSTLRGLGFVDVHSLAGGLVAWSRSVDRSLPVP